MFTCGVFGFMCVLAIEYRGVWVYVCINMVFPFRSPPRMHAIYRGSALSCCCPMSQFFMDQHGALSFWPWWEFQLQCSRHTLCQRINARCIQMNKTEQREGACTNIHFEKTHNEHTVASLAALSSSQQLNGSLYLALRLCRLSIAPLRQSSVTLNNGTLTFLAVCTLPLCNDLGYPFICCHITLDDGQINAVLIFPSNMRYQAN